ncbi:MAG: M56 family metallopeptidase [Streptosporangiaceae bacterium]
MTIFALLAAAAVVLGHLAGPALARQEWTQRHPVPAIVLWLATLCAAVAAAVGFVAFAVFSSPQPGHTLVEWALSCASGHAHSGTWEAAILSLPPVIAFLLAARIGVRRLRSTISARHRHGEMLRLVTRETDELADTCILDHPIPIAYCLPARGRPIVVSSGALDVLDPGQLAAVLDHERAHLRGRHHLIVALVDALAHTLPWAATFQHGRTALARLLEHAADDTAARRHGATTVFSALHKLTVLPSPAGTLGAGASAPQALSTRLNRLSNPVASAHGRRLAWSAAALSSLLPVAILTGWMTAIALNC